MPDNRHKRGKVYWTELGKTRGAEINKTRPCVIVSNDLAKRSSEDC